MSLQAHLGPVLHSLHKLQYESKAVSSEVKQAGATASLVADGGTRMQQMQHKAQALQQCIEDKLHQVIKIAS